MARKDKISENLKLSNYSLTSEGLIYLTIDDAKDIFRALESLGSDNSRPDDYDKESGLNKNSKTTEFNMDLADGSRVVMTTSEHGGTIIQYKLVSDESNIDIIAPSQPAGNPYDGLKDTLRGLSLSAWPHNCEDARLGIPYHGSLARSMTRKILEDQEKGIIIYALSSSMIHKNIPHRDNILVLVCHRLNTDGSITSSIATYNFELEDKPFYTNIAFHPYFYTPKGIKPMAVRINSKDINLEEFFGDSDFNKDSLNIFKVLPKLQESLKKAIFKPMKEYSNNGQLPSIELVTSHYVVTLTPLIGFNMERAHMGVWTDQFLRSYFCLELLEKQDEPFNPDEPDKVEGYTRINPGEANLIAIKMSAKLHISSEG